MGAALFAGLIAGYAIAIPVGAIGMYLLHVSTRNPLRVGVTAALGVASADGSYALLAVLGGSALASGVHRVATASRWVAAAVLALLAIRTAVSAIRRYGRPDLPAVDAAALTAGRAYTTLLGLTLLNPATIVYFAALVIGARASTHSTTASDQSLFVVAVFAASASWQLLLAGTGSLLGRVLSGRRGRLITALVSAVVIVFSAVRIAAFS